jgi:hypothetical protein
LEASISTLTDNLLIYRAPWAYLHRNLTGKYRVITVAGDTSSLDYLKREKEHTYADGLYLDVVGPKRISLVHTDADLSDFYLTNGGFKDNPSGASYEALSYISDSRLILDGSDFLAPPTPLPASETEGGATLEPFGRSFVNIPPRTSDYVTRPDLETELCELLLDDRHPVISLVGSGGIGKTSLALEVAHQLAASGEFFAIIWFSSRDIDLLPHGPKLVVSKIRTIEEVAAEFVRLMGPREAAEPQFKAIEYLSRAMNQSDPDERKLFIFDNFETLHSPAEL